MYHYPWTRKTNKRIYTLISDWGVNTRWKALDEIYIFSFAPFQISVGFQDFCTILPNSTQIVLIFKGKNIFCNFSSKIRRFFGINFRRLSVILRGVMPRLLYFRENFNVKNAKMLNKMFRTNAELLLQIL